MALDDSGSIPASLAAKQLIFKEQISIEIRKSSRIIGRAGVDIKIVFSCHCETVCLLINQNAQAKHHVNVGLDAEEYYQLKTK